MYLARWIIADVSAAADWEGCGLHPDGWLDLPARRRIDWFNPDLACVPSEHRWAFRLASYASVLETRHRVSCPRERSLRSILYAALKRGRNYLDTTSGATEFFGEVRAVLEQQQLNPVFDSVLEGNAVFAPELAMLRSRSGSVSARHAACAAFDRLSCRNPRRPRRTFSSTQGSSDFTTSVARPTLTPSIFCSPIRFAFRLTVFTCAIRSACYSRSGRASIWRTLRWEWVSSLRRSRSRMAVRRVKRTRRTIDFPSIPSGRTAVIFTPCGPGCKPKKWKR